MTAPTAASASDVRAETEREIERVWCVYVYGFGSHHFRAKTASGARYAAFKAIREAGYFSGGDGFWRFLANGVRVARVSNRLAQLQEQSNE